MTGRKMLSKKARGAYVHTLNRRTVRGKSSGALVVGAEGPTKKLCAHYKGIQ